MASSNLVQNNKHNFINYGSHPLKWRRTVARAIPFNSIYFNCDCDNKFFAFALHSPISFVDSSVVCFSSLSLVSSALLEQHLNNIPKTFGRSTDNPCQRVCKLSINQRHSLRKVSSLNCIRLRCQEDALARQKLRQ